MGGFPGDWGGSGMIGVMDKERLDALVQRAAGVSRSKAQGLIRTGLVWSPAGERLDKPGMRLDPATPLRIAEMPRYVSRGGQKLEAAIAAFHPPLEGCTAIDVGASTGGFTDCLLQHGAARVYAVDVGYGQLAWRLRQDPRVAVFERTNIRHLPPDRLPAPPDFFTADCSFISLRLVLPPLRTLLTPDAAGLVLIKPQFEAGRGQVGKGGVVRDETVREQTVAEVLAMAQADGFDVLGTVQSPLPGPAGNIEYFAYLRHRGAR